MLIQQIDNFALKNFEGPLDFLLNLIQREEIEIYDISIHELTQQFLNKLKEWQEKQVEKGAEFIGVTAYLMWLKSKMLLPKQEETVVAEEEDDPHFEIIHHLIDYCRFKQTAKELAKRQEEQSACFFRGIPSSLEWKKPLGIDHLSLEELTGLFKEMMARTPASRPQIYEENWKVSDKIRFIRSLIQKADGFPLEDLFSIEKSKLECIVIFLALLELMKIGEIGIGKQEHNNSACFLFKNAS
jgi:segregation and condensation protein A